jgi:hypothetical protein
MVVSAAGGYHQIDKRHFDRFGKTLMQKRSGRRAAAPK